MIKKRTALIWAVILVIITSMLTFTAANLITVSLGDKVIIGKSDYEDLNKLQKLLGLKEVIEDYYVDGADDDKLIEGAVKGMFDSLGDPYSIYMTKEEFKNFNESTQGAYGGIGIIVTLSDDGYVTVVAPIEGTPGEKAGLKTNDKIVKVGDKDVIGIELDAAVALMKGDVGTSVKLTVMRDAQKQPLIFDIKREEIILKAVTGKMLDNKLGYIRISMFDADTGAEFKKILKSLQSQQMKGLVLDLRQNPGGFVTQCIEVADELLDKGVIVYTEDKNKVRKTYNSTAGKLDVPFVILVDEGSASASEILSGAVKDRKAGLLIGTKTFGKGLVQTSKGLDDGTGFKLTIEKYYTPNGISINKIGIQPDIEVKPLEVRADQKPEDIKDIQLERAITELMRQIK